jgi:two-component system alkaline phosphatase synthesis response regulator PhoP/two-component system response regulator VicR
VIKVEPDRTLRDLITYVILVSPMGNAPDMNQHVLMIEDDREMVALGKLILERKGYQVLSAYDGAEGLRILRQERGKIDLLLLDLMMTGMDGWQVLAEMKADEQLRRIPVIILTARALRESSAQAALYADQVKYYVVKPFVMRELLTKIAEVLGG